LSIKFGLADLGNTLVVELSTSNADVLWHQTANRNNRRGAVALWVILAGPALLGMLILVIELAHIWLARIELENALGAAALAAVKEWGDAGGGSTECPREVGVAYADGNLISGLPLSIATNFGNATPNGNAFCAGNLIFGAIIDQNAPFRFDASVIPSCGTGQVRIEACKADSGVGGNQASDNRLFGVFYEDGPPALVIRSISFTIPSLANPKQQPYFDSQGNASKRPRVSDFDITDDLGDDGFPKDIPACLGNLANTTPAVGDLDLDAGVGTQFLSTLDVRGLDPDPVVDPKVDGQPGDLKYECAAGKFVTPDYSNWTSAATGGNPFGDMCFTFANQVIANNGNPIPDHYRTITIHFQNGTFNPPADPLDRDTFEFVRFGASINQLNPPALPSPSNGTNNNGDAFGIAPVGVTVTFLDTNTNMTSTCQVTFVNTGGTDNRSEALCAGGGSGNNFAVRAQATVQVNSLFCELAGVSLGPFSISAKETAYYDCDEQCPRLIRIEPANFFCPGPAP
jgi:hypothetical protein